MTNELSLFFVKPHRLAEAGEINEYLFSRLQHYGRRFLVDYRGLLRTTPEFWDEFYPDLELEPKLRVIMGYSNTNNGLIDVSLIYGWDSICQDIKDIVGPTSFVENFTQDNFPLNTIRARWGDPEKLENTAVHSSKPGEAGREIEIFKKFNLLGLIAII